jgi:MerR family transcriptional regulator/heat shock protein HspR
MSPERTGFSIADDAPVYAISVAARLAALHAQTLRQYDRLGLVTPTRVGGRNRLYSANDIARLREIADLSSQGLSLEGIRRVLELQEEVRALRKRLEELRRDQASTSLVVWRPATKR